MKRHYGKILGTNVTVIVVFMSIPNDTKHCLVVNPEKMAANVRSEFMELIDDPNTQRLPSIYDVLYRTGHPNGGSMLENFHKDKLLERFPTDKIIMVPAPGIEILLSEINSTMEKMSLGLDNISDAELENQRNVAKTQLEAQEKENLEGRKKTLLLQAEDLEDQAKFLIEEAKRKRAEAIKLDKPKTTKKTTKKVENVNESKSV